MAILGLLVERPDTAAGVGLRLREVFPGARWPRNVVHNNAPRLVKKGFVHCTKGPEPAFDRYEVTERGTACFREWVSQSMALPPVLRDGLQVRLHFLDERDELVSLIRTVRESEQACSLEYAAAHGRLKSTIRRARRPGTAEVDWHSKLRLIQIGDEVMLWGMMARRLQRLGDELEGLLHDDSAWAGSPGVQCD
jgi:DNA-binding PadR family transcriptional regulator